MTYASSLTSYYVYISGVWTDLLVVGEKVGNWGMQDNDPETRVANVGEKNLTLNNADGRYTPNGPSALSGWKVGLFVKEIVTYNSVDYVKFYGAISEISLGTEPKEQRVYITVLDWFDYASKSPVRVQPLWTNSKIGDVARNLLQVVPIQPIESTIDDGDFVFPYLLDSVKKETKLYSELSKLTINELGNLYMRHSEGGEHLIIESRTSRNGVSQLSTIPDDEDTSGYLLAEDGTFLLAEDSTYIVNDSRSNAEYDENDIVYKNVTYGKNVINRFPVFAYPKKTDTKAKIIYETEKPIRLAPREEKTFRIFWRDSVGKRVINAVPPSGNGTDVALCHFDLVNVIGGGLNGAGTGVGGYFLDDTGQHLIDNDSPFISFSKFGDGSLYLDGTNAWCDYPASSRFDFGSGDFWLEWWDYRLASTSGIAAISRDGTAAVPAFIFGLSNGVNYTANISSNGITFDIASGVSMGAVAINEWVHLAVGRHNGTLYTFKNGTLVTSVSASGTIYATPTKKLSLGRNNATYLPGNIDEFRAKKGECAYTATFTAPTEPYTLSAGTYYELNTAEDMSGTDLRDYATLSGIYGTEGAILTVQNTSTTTIGYMPIKIYGYGIYSDSPVEATIESGDETTGSIAEYGYQSTSLTHAYHETTDLGEREGERVIDFEKEPRTVLNEIGFVANKNQKNMISFLSLDVGDLIHQQIPDDGIDGYYYIQKVKTRTKDNTIFFNWEVKQAWTLEKGLSHVACEFAGGAATDAINYKYMPIVSSDAVTKRAYSAWIYLDAISATRNQAIIGTYQVGTGDLFYIRTDPTNILLSFTTIKFSVSGGLWTCPVNPFSLGTWVHVFSYFDASLSTNDPIIYVNGVAQSLTENVTPSGAATSEEGIVMTIGNMKDGSACFNGKIKDVRIYDFDRTTRSHATIAAAIYSEGAFGVNNYDGMVFNAFTVRTSELASYENLTLTDETLIDAYNGYIGTPAGSPITRYI